MQVINGNDDKLIVLIPFTAPRLNDKGVSQYIVAST
jgi:hypothetical protein